MDTRRFAPAPNGSAARLVVNVYLALLFLELAAAGLWMIHSPGAYGLPEWLINYAGGFVRRGLTGSMLLPLAHGLHLPAVLPPALLGILCYATLFLCLLRLFNASSPAWWAYALVLCPGAFAFPVISRTSFRKDVLFFALLSAIILCLRSGRQVRPLTFAPVLAIALPVLVLCQEPLFVYFPYLLAALYIAFPSRRTAIAIAGPGLALAGVALLFVSLHPGTPAQVALICAAGGYTPVETCPAGITIAGAPPLHVAAIMRAYGYLRHYSVALLLCLVPIAAAAHALWQRRALRPALRVLAAGAATSALGSLALFRLGVDWGRWINLHIISLTLLLLWIRTFGEDEAESVAAASTPTTAPSSAAQLRRKLISAAALALYATCWSMPGNLDRPLYGYISLAHKLLHFHGSLSN